VIWARCFAISMLWLLASAIAFAQDAKSKTIPESEKPYTASVEAVANNAEFEALHELYTAEDTLQLERPEQDAPPEIREPSPLPAWLVDVFAFLGSILKFVFYIGAFCLIAYIAFHIIMALWGSNIKALLPRKKAKQDEDDVILPSLRPDAASARSLLDEADALARQGKFAEAVHLLLYRSIEDIQAKRGQRLSTALTSREIGELDDLPPKPREALSPIIMLVERSFFGAGKVDNTDWQSARQSYERFAFKEAWT